MDYITGPKQAGCFFCEHPRVPAAFRENLVLVVQPHAMVIFNRYPFTAGHLLVAPRRHVASLDDLSDEEYARLQELLIRDPDTGDLIPGSGGVRKVRWGVKGRGKRGGIRVIYYARTRQGQIWMLTLYAKNEVESIPAHVLRQIKEEIDG